MNEEKIEKKNGIIKVRQSVNSIPYRIIEIQSVMHFHYDIHKILINMNMNMKTENIKHECDIASMEREKKMAITRIIQRNSFELE